MQDLIEKASLALGRGAPDDYKITPTDFPDKLKKYASELSAILQYSSFQEKAGRYEQHDAVAIATQAKFKGFAHQATWAIGCAAIAGSLLAALAAAKKLDPNDLVTSYLLFALGFIATVGGGFAVYRLHLIKTEKLLERWMEARAKAETERLGYFSAIASRREDLNQDERNAERYSRTADILSNIAERHDDVIVVVNEGKNPAIIIEYVDAVNDQLSLEHRQWTSDASEMSSALSALEESISDSHKGESKEH